MFVPRCTESTFTDMHRVFLTTVLQNMASAVSVRTVWADATPEVRSRSMLACHRLCV